MENHPIPQDVTGFKFRLIGSITLKQFLYLLGAGIFGLLIYIFPIPWLAKVPLMALGATISLALAFVPIDGRPMDRMIANFLKALPSENEFLYHKKGVQILAFDFVQPAHAQHAAQASQTSETTAAKRALLLSQLKSAYQPDEQEMSSLNAIHGLFDETPGQLASAPKVVQADSQPTNSASAVHMPSPAHQAAKPAPLPVIPAAPAASTVVPVVPQAQPPAAQAATVQQPAQQAPAPQASQTPPSDTPPPAVPDVPNVIFGRVTDARGRVLPQVLVEVLDQKQVPVRAFKTSVMGEFKSATPLPNGNYSIHLEDSLHKQEFKPVPVVLNGSIMQPFNITSVDQREKLRQELFGK